VWSVAVEVITLIASVVAAGASVASVMIVVRKPRHDLKLRLYVDDQSDDRLNIELELESPEPATIRKIALTLYSSDMNRERQRRLEGLIVLDYKVFIQLKFMVKSYWTFHHRHPTGNDLYALSYSELGHDLYKLGIEHAYLSCQVTDENGKRYASNQVPIPAAELMNRSK